MTRSGPQQRAFTLVELILAVGITAVLAALLLSIVTNTLGIWQRGAAGLQLESAGGLVMERVVADLEAWVQMEGRPPWLALADESTGRVELRWLSLVASTGPTGTDVAGVRLVAYVWDETSRQLHRWESTALASLENGYDLAASPVVVGPEWLLGENVRGFRVRWLDAAGVEMAAEAPAGLPRQAVVEVSMIDAAGQARLDAVAAGASTEGTAEIEAETTRTLTRWVALPAGGGQ